MRMVPPFTISEKCVKYPILVFKYTLKTTNPQTPKPVSEFVEFWNSKHSKLVTFKEKDLLVKTPDSWLVQKAFGFRRSPKPTSSARCVLRLLRSLARSPSDPFSACFLRAASCSMLTELCSLRASLPQPRSGLAQALPSQPAPAGSPAFVVPKPPAFAIAICPSRPPLQS